jgi:osmotically-inducible protein OsmY
MKYCRNWAVLSFTILNVSACASTRQQEGGGEYVDNAAVTAKVKAELLRDPLVSGFQVNVETFKGIVQLSGFVDSAAEREQAVAVARRVNGVKDVKNTILIRGG